jgi:4-amino-4-deoxy-L-arabinose transferase-like glycosyltransferase
MVEQSKRLLSYPTFIVLFAYTARMAVFFYMSHMGRATPNPVRAFLPYGFELGLVARSIAAGHGFSSPLRFGDTGPTAWFTPIYPYLTAGVFKLWGIFSDESRLILETLNCAFGALTVIPIYGIARRVFGKSVAVGAAWAWVFLPASFFFAITWIWDTALAALFLALIFWATLAVREAKSIWPWAGYGALWVTGVLINPSLLSLFPFLAGWALWQSDRGSSSRVKFSAAMLLVFAIGLVPWTIRNYRVFGKFIPLRSNFGLELWLGNNPNVPDTWSPWLHPDDDPAEWAKYKRMGEIAFMAAKEHEAFVFMRTHPGDTLNFIFRRFMETWLAVTESPADIWGRSSLNLKAIFLINVLLSLLAWLGAMFVNRNRHPEAAPFVMVLLIFPLVFYLTHSTLRYRFPMDPILIVLSAYAVAHLASLARGRTSHAQGSVTPVASLPTT